MRKSKFILLRLLFVGFIFFLLAGCEKPEDNKNVFSINVESLEFQATEETKDFKITCNSDWEITGEDSWVSLSYSTGNGDATISVTVDENSDETERNVTLQIMCLDEVIELAILQEGHDKWNGFSFREEPDASNMLSLPMNELTVDMGAGWNLGNTLEAIGGETAWGNPLTTKKFIDSVKAAGFNIVRIPVAWSVFEDEANYIIDTDWMLRVEEVVNYVLDNDMYAMVNIHWDGGWMQPTFADQREVNHRLEKMWNQIATHFRDYNDKLLFAGSNEVHVENEWGTPTAENVEVQNEFNQIFVTTVRKTGGRNAYRYLIVQGYNTNIDHTIQFAKIPDDIIEGGLLMEVHYYDPYNFTINENSNITQWGSIATDPSLTETWANESYADAQFAKMKTKFIDKGIGVILGEYAAMARTEVDGHEVYREYYIKYISQSAVNSGIVPVYWDNGYSGNNGMGIFNRESGEQVYPNLIDAIISAVE